MEITIFLSLCFVIIILYLKKKNKTLKEQNKALIQENEKLRIDSQKKDSKILGIQSGLKPFY